MLESGTPSIGVCRTFLAQPSLAFAGPAIGVCRTFFGKLTQSFRRLKPSNGLPLVAYKASFKVFSVLSKFKQRSAG
jgi:hypothetical protein